MTTLAHAKMLFENGAIRGATVSPAPMESGWILQVSLASGRDVVLEKARGGMRVYRKADAAIAAAKEIGIRSLSVKIE